MILPPDDEDFELRYPYLWEGMTMCQYADGTPRIPWEISIKRIPGGYLVRVTNHDLLEYSTVSVLTYDEHLQALESKISGINPGWMKMEKSYVNKKGLDKFKKKP